MYQPDLEAVGDSLALSALCATLPLLVLFVLLGELRITAWKASLAALVMALVVAVGAYSMPFDQALLAGSQGAVFGFFPILWIVINAIWIYNMTVQTGHFDVSRRSFAQVSDDQRIQAIIVAFCFGLRGPDHHPWRGDGHPSGRPRGDRRPPDADPCALRAARAGLHHRQGSDTAVEVTRAYAPYLIIIAIFSIAQIPVIKDLLAKPTIMFQWPGLELLTTSGDPSTLPTFSFAWLQSAGTLLVLAGRLTIPAIGISGRLAWRAYRATYKQLATAIVTVMTVLALAYVMNSSGQTASLGSWMAAAGSAFAVLSPILGWLGVAVTGSDTSSNSLFGGLQIVAAGQAGLNPELMAASNSSGGVLGKMISPQNLAIAASAVGLAGREGDIFRRVFGWSIAFLALMCLIVLGQATVLSWMLP